MQNNIYIASDHAGFPLKAEILKLVNLSLVDLGTSSSQSVDYPDIAFRLVDRMLVEDDSRGILICGSGIGMAIAANRNPKIRAGLAFNSEIAKLMRQHNNANVLVLPGRFIDVQEALKCVDNFLSSTFEYGRHEERIKKLGKI
jgi:ribose 5-phosphate isomerase B